MCVTRIWVRVIMICNHYKDYMTRTYIRVTHTISVMIARCTHYRDCMCDTNISSCHHGMTCIHYKDYNTIAIITKITKIVNPWNYNLCNDCDSIGVTRIWVRVIKYAIITKIAIKSKLLAATGWQRGVECLIFIGLFLQKSPMMMGSLPKETYNLRHNMPPHHPVATV